MRYFLSSLIETLEVALIAIVSVLVIRTYLVQPFLVSGDSMEPNFSSGNYLLVDELSYQFRKPERGEVIVFKFPDNPSVYYIKRIIGLPGEKIIIKNGEVEIFNQGSSEGKKIEEKYIPVDFRTSGDVEVVLKDEEYFVMGDNRMFSFDSRSWGPLEKKYIMGIARFNLWPLSEARAVSIPLYQ
ncbi:MAG: signal peptidase I [Candidatus Pacebacteria bacterium]|nr:signal peptidase I [Candidatus Paceibacterota bacterium]